jgi:hypothetical protein
MLSKNLLNIINTEDEFLLAVSLFDLFQLHQMSDM